MSESREKQERVGNKMKNASRCFLNLVSSLKRTTITSCFSEMQQCREELLLMAEKKHNPHYFYLFQKDPLANYPHKNKGQTNITNNIYFQ